MGYVASVLVCSLLLAVSRDSTPAFYLSTCILSSRSRFSYGCSRTISFIFILLVFEFVKVCQSTRIFPDPVSDHQHKRSTWSNCQFILQRTNGNRAYQHPAFFHFSDLPTRESTGFRRTGSATIVRSSQSTKSEVEIHYSPPLFSSSSPSEIAFHE